MARKGQHWGRNSAPRYNLWCFTSHSSFQQTALSASSLPYCSLWSLQTQAHPASRESNDFTQTKDLFISPLTIPSPISFPSHSLLFLSSPPAISPSPVSVPPSPSVSLTPLHTQTQNPINPPGIPCLYPHLYSHPCNICPSLLFHILPFSSVVLLSSYPHCVSRVCFCSSVFASPRFSPVHSFPSPLCLLLPRHL